MNLNDFNPKLRLKNLNLKKIDSNLVNSSLCFEKNHRIAQHSFERYLFFFPGYVIFRPPWISGWSFATDRIRSFVSHDPCLVCVPSSAFLVSLLFDLAIAFFAFKTLVTPASNKNLKTPFV